MRSYNSVLVGTMEPLGKDQKGKQIYKGTHIFSYTWESVGGGFPQVLEIMKLNGRNLKGFPSTSVKGCVDARSSLKAEQGRWFGDDCNYIDVNEELGRSPLQTKDLLVYLVRAEIVTSESVIACAASRKEMEDYLKKNGVQIESTRAEALTGDKIIGNDSNDDSGVACDEESETIRLLKIDLEEEKKKRTNEAAVFAREKEEWSLKLNQALRGGAMSNDYGAERTLLMLEQKLKGKRLVEEEDFQAYKNWAKHSKVEESAVSILKESEVGLIRIKKGYEKMT